MADFWNNIKRLFQSAEQSSPSQPLVHELIQRSAEEKEDYQFWKETLVCQRLQDWLANQYALFRHVPDDIDESLDFLDTPSSKGFVIHFYKTRYSRRDVTHLFDFLKEKVLALGYRTQISDMRSYNRPDWVESVHRHYLKPPPDFGQDSKYDQQFGNITIELTERDGGVHNLKFRATTYRDHQFREALQFEQLMQELFI
ncbi:MAG: hypothetical protein R3350_04460 [Saprospiraceae bacterium]|nr:hypothetical protein [Saprospiraceae bacterium]